jgi:hypothetical protein
LPRIRTIILGQLVVCRVLPIVNAWKFWMLITFVTS